MTACRHRRRAAGSVLSLALLAGVSGVAAAQDNPLELRLDVITLLTSGGRSTFDVGLPGTLALALYLDDRVAVEPRVSIHRESGDDASVTRWAAGMFLPIHFTPNEGRRGFFVAPGIQVTGIGGDATSDAFWDFGVDLGVKLAVRERVSVRLALLMRDGDSTRRSILGGSVGLSLFWR